MYIAYRVENYIEGNKVSKNFAIWGQNDKDYNWSIIAKPLTLESAIKAAKEICEAQKARIEARKQNGKEYHVACESCGHIWKYQRKGKIVK